MLQKMPLGCQVIILTPITLDLFIHLATLVNLLIWNTGVLSVLLNTDMMPESQKVKTF